MFLRKLMFFRFGGREVHMPRLIGAFILFSALLFFVQASAQMFNSWDNIKEVNRCLASNDFSRTFCQETAEKSLGLYVGLDQKELSLRQFWSVILGPMATVLFWLAVLFLGWMVYRTGDLVLPIEEVEKVFPDKKGIGKKRV